VPVPLQLLAAAWAFPARSAGTATGSSILAGVWFGYGLVFVNGGSGTHPALGMMLAAASAALLVPAAAELTSAVVPAAVIAATATRFGIAAVFELTGSSGWKHAAGYAGLVVAALALYGALALELESALGRRPLPIWPLAQGKVAREGSLLDQIRGIETSPGVRRKL
jgi:succinate-acetate transporter protein